MRALISVSDKQGVVAFANALAALGVELISTGNTHRLLSEAGLAVQLVSRVTGYPEILDGRVKTLHPAIHGAILARRDLPNHQQQLVEHNITPIDIVVVNLYPFAQTITRPDLILTDALEQIDIGGVTLLRAAAKNFPYVIPLVDPADYDAVLTALREDAISLDLRRRLAARAFAHTATYDAAISTYLNAGSPSTIQPLDDQTLATTLQSKQPLHLDFAFAQELRYGENPHQQAALYGTFLDYFEQIHGKELSYNNIIDTAAAQELIEEFPTDAGDVALAIVKHTNPCGVGVGSTPLEAWQRAFATDTQSSFGGIVVLNSRCDLSLANAIDEIFTEIIIAPDFAPDALDVLRRKKNRRLLRRLQPLTRPGAFQMRSLPDGLLLQEADCIPLDNEQFTVVTQRTPTADEEQALRFAWRVVKHVKSNAIVYASSTATLGIGAGQMSRVDSSYLARWKAQNAGLSLEGSVIASDAFFPFADGVEAALAAGATAIIQPGGSVRDNDVIAAADRAGAAMVFTGRRHFRH